MAAVEKTMESTWLEGRTVLITGATSGIGLATALAIATKVKRLLLVGRDAALVAATTERFHREFPQLNVHGITADLALQSDTRKVAEWALTFPELHGLVNNVGAVFDQKGLTADGIERQFAVNYVNQVLLTRLLLPHLLSSADAQAPNRIVMVSSLAHTRAKPLTTEFAGLDPYVALKTYRQSKLAQAMFTVELARRLDGLPVTVNALCPGFTRTGIGTKHTQNAVVRWIWSLSSRFFAPVEVGAAKVVQVLADDAMHGVSGAYFEKSAKSPFAPLATDPIAAKTLWDETCDRLKLPRELDVTTR